MSISMDSIYDKMSEAVNKSEDEITTFLQSGKDLNNPANMIQLQRLTSKWSNIMNLSSNLLNTIKEATKSVVSNMR